MMLSGVIASGTPLRRTLRECSDENYESLRRNTKMTNIHLGQLGRQSSRTRSSSLRVTDTRPANCALFCDYKGRLSSGPRVQGSQTGAGTYDFRHTPIRRKIPSFWLKFVAK